MDSAAQQTPAFSFASQAVVAWTPGTISTLAGNGTAGFGGDNGAATSAELNLGSTSRSASDGTGNVYIVDAANNRIRKVTANGTITTVAGTGVAGYSGDGGFAVSAEIERLGGGIAVDSSGNIYFTEFDCIREINVAGIINTIVGTEALSGFSGDGGPAAQALLNDPAGLAVDAAGDLFITDYGNNRIREVVGGKITTVAGSNNAGFGGDGGSATSAELLAPAAVAMSSTGELYIADAGNNRIREVVGGIINTIAGNGTAASTGSGGLAAVAELDDPCGVAVDAAGDVYVSECGSALVRKVNGNGYIYVVAGSTRGSASGDGGSATSATLEEPTDVAVDATGDLIITDPPTARVRFVNVAIPPALSFAQTDTGLISTDSPKQVLVSNIGNQNLDITAVTVSSSFLQASSSSGTNCAAPGVLLPGNDCALAIDFQPAVSGTITGTATLTDNALTLVGSKQTLALNGTGVLLFAKIAVGGLASSVTAGTPVTVTVTAQDNSGNTVTGYTGTVSFTSSDGQATLPAAYTYTSSDAGVHTFSVTFQTVGLQTLTAKDSIEGVTATASTTVTSSISTPAATPTFSPAPGTYSTTQSVTISDTTSGATIYYTTNGTAPTTSSTVYSGPITVASTETIEAIAVASGYTNSAVGTGLYTISSVSTPAATPAFSPAPGTYSTTQSVTITDATSGATIYYTTNGSTPTTSSTVYSGPITVASTETIEAIAVASGYSNSAVATALYTITAAQDFGLSLSPTALTIQRGQSGSTLIAVTPLNGFNQEVTFACSNVPTEAQCVFAPTSVTPNSPSSSASLTIITTNATTTGILRGMPRPGGMKAVVLMALMLGIFAGWRRTRGLYGLRIALLFAISLWLPVLGCNFGPSNLQGGGNPGTPIGTSQITVTAMTSTTPVIQHTAVLTVTITP
jgi:hypothetical protein